MTHRMSIPSPSQRVVRHLAPLGSPSSLSLSLSPFGHHISAFGSAAVGERVPCASIAQSAVFAFDKPPRCVCLCVCHRNSLAGWLLGHSILTLCRYSERSDSQ